jgi:ATP-dependent Clp protease ATP-binding subunit ClpA
MIAQAFGVSDWNGLSSAIHSEASSTREDPRRPDASLNPISVQLESVLNQTFAYATGRKQEEVTVEHLLLFLLEDADALRVVMACGGDPGELGRRLSAFINSELKGRAGKGNASPEPTLGFQRVLQRAFVHGQAAGHLPVTSTNMLVAIFSEKGSYAEKLLTEHGMAIEDAICFISHATRDAGGDFTDSPSPT